MRLAILLCATSVLIIGCATKQQLLVRYPVDAKGYETMELITQPVTLDDALVVVWEKAVCKGLQVLDGATLAQKHCIASCTERCSAAMDPDGRWLAVVGSGSLAVFDPKTGSPLTQKTVGGAARAVAVSPDGSRLAVATVGFFDTATWEPGASLSGEWLAAAFTHDSKGLLRLDRGGDGRARLSMIDTSTGQTAWTETLDIKVQNQLFGNHLAVHPTGEMVVITVGEALRGLRYSETGATMATEATLASSVDKDVDAQSLAFSRDGSKLAVGHTYGLLLYAWSPEGFVKGRELLHASEREAKGSKITGVFRTKDLLICVRDMEVESGLGLLRLE